MRKRILSGIVGFFLLTLILIRVESILLNIGISIVIVFCVYELLVATKYIHNKVLVVISIAFAAAVPFFRMPTFNITSRIFSLIFIMVLFAMMMLDRFHITLEKIGLVFMISIVVPIALSSVLYIRDEGLRAGRAGAIFMVLYTFIVCWGNDIGALFAGRFFGKHKLSPKISPKKTVEGAIGGVIFEMLLIAALVWFFNNFKYWGGIEYNFSPLWLYLIGLIGAPISIFGDLAASVIKRQCAIKDFGSLIPGHGGVMDRFDSVLFVAPYIYVMTTYFPLISK